MTYPITINIVRKVTVNLTADQWQLFAATMNCDAAASALNIAASEGLSMATPELAFRRWERTADALERFGAGDSEPRYVMNDLIEQVFGERY